MLRRFVAGLVVSVAAVAAAGMSDTYATYFDGPAGFLLTAKERSAWKKVETDAEAVAFIQLFWARRDPDLATPANELKASFDERVRIADKQFGYATVRGALTDRGRALILLGPARESYLVPPGSKTGDSRFQTTRVLGRSLMSYSERSGVELWLYDLDKLPGQKRKDDLVLIFVETQAGQEDFVLDRGHRANTLALSLLGKAASWYLVNPGLERAPHAIDLEAAAPSVIRATPEQLAWFDLDPAPAVEGALGLVREGLITGPRSFAWVHLLVPPTAARADTVVARVSDQENPARIANLATAIEPEELAAGVAYEVSLPLPPGSWRIELALAAGERPLLVEGFELETTAASAGKTAFSPLYWGCEVAQEPEMTLGDPFNVGGWRVHPRASGEYRPSEQLDYVSYVLEPVLDEQGKPHVESVLELYRGEKKLVRSAPQPATLSKVADGLWMFGGTMPLTKFTEPGAYRLRIELRQTADGAEGAGEIPFTMVAAEGTE